MAKFKFIFSWLWDFLRPTIQLLLSATGRALMDAAARAVVEAEATDARGDEKRKVAFNIVKRDMEKAGYVIGAQVTTSLINSAIELMVDKLQSK